MTGRLLDAAPYKTYAGNVADLSISLPFELQHYVDLRVAAEGFASSGEFVRDLLERDQRKYQLDVGRVKALVQEGIDSGVVDVEPEDALDEIIADIRAKHG